MKPVRLEDVPKSLGRPEIRPWNSWAQEVEKLHPHSVLEITDEILSEHINRFRGANIRTARKHGLQIIKRGRQVFLAKINLNLDGTERSVEDEFMEV